MNSSKLTSLTPNLMVEDVNKTIDYYENVLGFQKIMSVPEGGHWLGRCSSEIK